MGEHHEEVVETKFVATDKASGVLGKIAGQANRVSNAFDHASSMLATIAGAAGGAAAALGVGEIVKSTHEYLETLKQVRDVTGMATQRADGLLDAMQRVGIGTEAAAHMMNLLSRRGALIEMQMMRTGRSMGGMATMMARLHIDIRKGPEAAIIGMAKAFEKGKLNAGMLMRVFAVPPSQIGHMVELLKEGPAKIKENIDKMAQAGLSITEENMEAFERIEHAQHAIQAGWKRIQLVVGKELLPVIAELTEYVSHNVEGWVSSAKEFGTFLRNHLKEAIHLAMTLGKVMIANAAVQRFTGVGLGGHLMNYGGKAAGFIRGGGGALGTAGRGMGGALLGAFGVGRQALNQVGSGMSAAATGLATGNLGGAAFAARGALGGMAGGAQGILGKLLGGLLSLRPLLGVLLRLTAVGAVIAVGVMLASKAVEMFKTNAMGLRDILLGWWEKMQARFAVLKHLFGELFGPSTPMGQFFEVLIPTVAETLGTVFDTLLTMIQTIVIVIRKVQQDWSKAITEPVATFVDAWAEANALTRLEIQRTKSAKAAEKAAHRDAPTDRARNYMDFRNSKFDITQKFAEGFDPDRIAVAFTRDLSALGEHKLQSGFSPLFTAS